MRTLRPYQQDAVDAINKEFEKVQSTLVVLPTGCGKTVVFAKIASQWERGNILILAHREELLFQAQKKIGDEMGYKPVIEKAEMAMDTECLWQGGVVLVGSVQTMRGDRRLEKFQHCPFDLIVVDEAHHATAASYVKVIEYFTKLNPQCKVLGVTATPNRADETALGIIFNTCAYQMTIREAIDQGWLVDIRQEYVTVEGLDFDEIRTNTKGWDKGDWNAGDLERVLTEEKHLHAMAGPVLELSGDDKKCLIFTAGVAHAHMLASILNRHKDGKAVAIDGETDSKERRNSVSKFQYGELQYLCNFGVFTEGFDVPSVNLVVMGRPTQSVSLYTQMLGRGTRPLDGVVDGKSDAQARKQAMIDSGKHEMTVLDFVGNSRHKLPVSALDVLGGNYDVEVRPLAEESLKKNPRNVDDALERANTRLLLLEEEEHRKEIKAKAEYQSAEVNPFAGGGPGGHKKSKGRGGATDAQIQFLVNLGVEHETASGYSKRQAGAVIDKLTSTRCTEKQQQILIKYGENPNVNFHTAKEIIDEIAQNGWRPRTVGA